MSLFLPQDRRLKYDNDSPRPFFPQTVRATILLGPEDAFGVEGGSYRTTIRPGSSPSLSFSANEGISKLMGDYIDRLSFSQRLEGGLAVNVDGNIVRFEFEVGSEDEMQHKLLAVNIYLPPLLTLQFGTFVWIREYTVRVGDASLRVECLSLRVKYAGGSAAVQQQRIEAAFRDMMIANHAYRRWMSAAYYYRNALRLGLIQPDPLASFSEIILNLAKSIEVLFSSNRKRLRETAKAWGFERDFIENKLVPLLLIRDKLDVAHAAVTPLTSAQRDILQTFVFDAEGFVKVALLKVSELIKAGRIVPPNLADKAKELESDKTRLLETIARYLANNNKG